MSKLIVVLGATGKQGGSVLNAFHQDPIYRVRAVVRDVNAASAKALRTKGVETVQGDTLDEESLVKAFEVRVLPEHIEPSCCTHGDFRQRI
jgi:uncharacterized protein YbjT (DUF2867 family)